MDWKTFLARFKNAGTILTVAALVVLVLVTNGVEVDNERVMTTVKAVCGILVVLGIVNNPENSGLDIPDLIGKKTEKSEDKE